MTMLLVLLLAIVVVGMWIGGLTLLSYCSGWPKLASVYRAERPPTGRCFPMQGAKIGDVYYVGCLAIYTSHEGIYISIWPIFRFREPPLFIPWSDLRNPREKRWFFTRMIEVDIGSPHLGRMWLSPSVFRDTPSPHQSLEPTAGRRDAPI
jgi:hypothetical protein